MSAKNLLIFKDLVMNFDKNQNDINCKIKIFTETSSTKQNCRILKATF